MARSLLSLILSVGFVLEIYAANREVVSDYCRHFSLWSENGNTENLEKLEELLSVNPVFRIGNSLMGILAKRDSLPETDTYLWNSYITEIQKEIDKGIRISYSEIQEVPQELIDYTYPGVEYIACRGKANGSLTADFHDLFILKDNRIAMITDYVIMTDSATGKKSVDINYLELARIAFADRDYQKCYDLYKKGALKQSRSKNKYSKIDSSDIFPYVESCIALGKWKEAMQGITDKHTITNRKRWINGKEWTLTPSDLKIWNKDKEPLMQFLFEKTVTFYTSNARNLIHSPLINHISKLRNIPISNLLEEAADYLWEARSNWYVISPIIGAAELNHPEAQEQLGLFYLTGHGSDPYTLYYHSITPDTVKAVKWLERAADNGRSHAANLVASLLLSGRNVKPDANKAFSLFSHYASGTNFDAKFGTAVCYFYGFGTSKDYSKALSLLKETEDWHPDIPFLIGEIYYRDNYDPKAVRYYERVLKRKDIGDVVRAAALKRLADCYRNGRCGLPIDSEKADSFLFEAERLGYKPEEISNYFISLTDINVKTNDE